MYVPKSDAEKVTVKGSHGESSLQRESDSFGFYNRTVSQNRGQQSGAHPEDRQKQKNTVTTKRLNTHTKNHKDQQLNSNALYAQKHKDDSVKEKTFYHQQEGEIWT